MHGWIITTGVWWLQVKHVAPLQVEYIWMWFWIIDDPLRCRGIIFAWQPPLQADCGNVQINFVFEKLERKSVNKKKGYETIIERMTSTPAWCYYPTSTFLHFWVFGWHIHQEPIRAEYNHKLKYLNHQYDKHLVVMWARGQSHSGLIIVSLE